MQIEENTSQASRLRKNNLLATYSDWLSFLHCSRVYFPGEMENGSWRKHSVSMGDNLQTEHKYK